MQNGDRWSIAVARGVDVGNRTGNPQLAGSLQVQQSAGRPGGERRSVGMRHRRCGGDLQHPIVTLHRGPGIISGRGEHGEDSATHPAGPHPREIQMTPRATAGDQCVIRASECIVVTVEDRDHGCTLPVAYGN